MTQNPLKYVLEKDICIGCGICAIYKNSPYKIDLDVFGMYKAKFSGKNINDKILEKNLKETCPFSNESLNENEISKIIFNEIEKEKELIGKYINFYAGYVNESNFREKGSSGGIGSWILSELIEKSYVDKIIHVKESKKGGLFFEYSISKSIKEIQKGAKSRYYPIKMDEIIQIILDDKSNSKYAIIGIPCFIKGLRLLGFKNKIIKEKIIFHIGLVCGHLKSSKFAEYFAYQTGKVKKENIKTLNFREKTNNGNAIGYGFSVTDKNNNVFIKNNKKIIGSDWGMNFFKYNACDYCDDIFAETADLVIGDAWIKPYINDDKGNNIIITRNKTIDKIINDGIKNNKLKLDIIDYKEIIKSQKGGIRHKIEGVKYRLFKNKINVKKRIKADNNISLKYKIIFKLRELLKYKSNKLYKVAEERGNINYFTKKIMIYFYFYKIIMIFIHIINKLGKKNL